MKRQVISIITLAALLIMGISLAGCATAQGDGKTLFIAGTYGSLSRGVYDGSATVADLKRHGDFAAGTLNAIDGELVGLDGIYYQIGAKGKINPVDDTRLIPNAIVTFFKPDKVISIDKPLGYQGLQEYVNGQLPTPNIFYAMKVTGKFDWIKARSLTKLTKPYPATPYPTITQNEPTFEFTDVESTLVVFIGPPHLIEITYPGYHAHFINSDGKYGGHVLDCRMASGRVELAAIPDFTVNLPQNSEYYKADFTKGFPVAQLSLPSAAAVQVQKVVQAKLDLLQADMSSAAAGLATVPLKGTEARQVLSEMYIRHPGIIDLVATEAAGTMVTFVPDSYRQYEGKFIGDYEMMKNFYRDKQPVLSRMFRAVEGIDALVLMVPVFSDKGEFKGSLSALFKADQLFAWEFAQFAEETGVELLAMQPDGLILYNSDGTETGKNMFTDPMYQTSSELIALGKAIAVQESGSGSYTFGSHETGKQVKKQAAWQSAGLHGTKWRLVAVAESSQ